MSASSDFIELTKLETIWDQLAPGFCEARLELLQVDGVSFQKVYLKPNDELSPVRIRLGHSLHGVPRFAAYRYRLAIIPSQVLGGHGRWQISQADIAALIGWARHARHVITFSTLKSGASFPLSIHAQSFPEVSRDSGTRLTALRDVAGEVLVDQGKMPKSKSLEIRDLGRFPLRGLRLTGSDDHVASKSFELALNYDHLKAFNLVILPPAEGSEEALVHFFPRRPDGRAIFKFHGARWQIAALEANGLLQAQSEKAFDDINAETVRELFSTTGLSEKEFGEFLTLLETF